MPLHSILRPRLFFLATAVLSYGACTTPANIAEHAGGTTSSTSSGTPGSSTGGMGSGGAGTGGAGTGGTGTGGTNSAAPPPCTWTKKTSNAACPSGPCPIVLDEELTCKVGLGGLRVAPAPDATWLATGTRLVYRITAAGEEWQDGVPQEFAFANREMSLALGPDGVVHLATDTTRVIYPGGKTTTTGGAMYAKFAGGVWTSSLIQAAAPPNNYDVTPVIDLEAAADGTPRAWIVSNPPSGHSLATPGPGGWVLTPVAFPAGAGGYIRFTLGADGSPIAFGQVSNQLHAIVGGVERTVGGPFQGGNAFYAVTAAPAPAAPAGALFAAALADASGIRVVGEPASGPEFEVTVPGTLPPAYTCPAQFNAPPAACTGTCHETATGVEPTLFALAWTDDGVAWLVWVVTALDQMVSFNFESQPVAECLNQIGSDSSLATLHVARVALDGSAPQEVLVMPVDRPAGASGDQYTSARMIDARGFGKDLAIGLRTGWIGSAGAARVLRVDTTSL